MSSTPSSLASPDEVTRLLHDRPDAIIADVREISEILEQGHVSTGHRWLALPGGTPTAAPPLLATAAADLFPQRDTPIVLYCGSGKRAAAAQALLTSMGYSAVLNAGGFSSLGYLQPK